MIRVLVAEDSPTSLTLLLGILGTDPEIEVAGTVGNGVEAVRVAKRMRPDIIVMDIHMPEMNGFEATRQIMIDAPTPIVIVSSSVDVRAVSVSMDALRAGALTVLPKPPGPGAPEFEETARQFVATVKSMAKVKVVRRWNSQNPHRSPSEPVRHLPPPTAETTPRVLAIAASTGGPAALYRIFSELPRNLPVPVLVVQHIAHGFVEGFATWLGSGSPLRVKVAEFGERLAPGTAYLAPDDLHLGLFDRSIISVSSGPPRDGFRPSASFLFESVAKMYGSTTVAVILTGMGEDGVEGLRLVRELGGRIVAQDEETSVVFGMPAAAIGAGLADLTLPISAIGPRLQRIIMEKKT